MKTKKSYEGATSSFHNLLDQIKEADSMKWANNADTIVGMTTAHANLQVGLTSFSRQFLSMDLATLRKSFEPECLVSNCSKLSLDLDGLISALVHEVTQLVRMHAVRK
jgi:hypothetical protein